MCVGSGGRLGGVWLGVGRQGGESECGSVGWSARVEVGGWSVGWWSDLEQIIIH